MDALAERLAARTLELVDIPSVSREEGPIVEHAAGSSCRASSSSRW